MRQFKFAPSPEPFEIIQGGITTKKSGRPLKTSDAIAQEKVDDIDKLRSLGLDFSYNEMTGQIEFVGKSGEVEFIEGPRLSYLGSELAVRFGQSLVDTRLKPAVSYLAHENCYDPRVRFLDRCEEEYEWTDDIHKISSIYFDNNSEICDKAMTRLMVGLVARAYNPGCSMSWLPILVGDQGAGKSMFSRNLVPEHMFAEINADLTTLMREPYRLHTGWLLEMPEIDHFFKPQFAESLKNLITLQVDEIRKPYELPTKARRGFAFIGTSNSPQFLVDSTGNRRFIPISITSGFQVPWRNLIEKRGSLWASAVKLYKQGYAWEFSTGELAQLREYQDNFMERDAWFPAIQKWISSKKSVSTAEILELCLDISVASQHNGHQRRAGAVMRGLGWSQSSRKINGVSKRVWVRTDKAEPQTDSLKDF